MFHMLTCFNLQPDETISEFRRAISGFATHMQSLELLQSMSPIGRRQTDTIMDTDAERDHQYFFTMSFRDREQCDLAVAHIYPHAAPTDALHEAVYAGIRDQVFICWEDIED
jgi:hypothetical protein